jgi:RNA polymerase sigma factor (sigma-70 family)
MSDELNFESFYSFLTWLDGDRDSAAEKYEALRAYLIAFLNRRHCAESEKLADDALNIFMRRLPHLGGKISDPLPYLIVVARHLHTEHITTRHLPLSENVRRLSSVEEESDEEERIFEFLDECLQHLDPDERELFLGYYAREKQEKIDFRKELAEQLGITANALRLRIYHIKSKLRQCIEEKLARPRQK